MLWNLLGTLALAYGGLAALLFFFQENLAYYPQIGREILSTPRTHGLDYEPLTLATPDGERLDAWFVPRPQARGAALAATRSPVLVAHSPDDGIIPFRHAEILFEAASEPKVFLQLAGGHNDGFIFMRAAWVDVLADFLIRHSGGE